MVWLVLYFVVISLSRGDRDARYLLPCYPPLAVLAGRALAAALANRGCLRGRCLSLPLLALGIMAVGVWLASRASPVEMHFYSPIIVTFLSVFAVVILVFTALAARGRLRQGIVLAAAGSLCAYVAAYAVIMQRLDTLRPWPVVGSTINRLHHQGDRILTIGDDPTETNFVAYWVQAPIEAVDEGTFVDIWRRERVFALMPPELFARLEARLHPVVLLRTPLGWSLVTNLNVHQPEAGKHLDRQEPKY